MRSTNKNRSRGKNGRKSLGNIVNRVFESAGPEGKVRGTPQQIIEKYLTLSRDSQTAGDRIAAENFQQHAEHYIRLLAEAQRETAARQEASQQQQQQPQPDPQPAADPQRRPAPAAPQVNPALATIEPVEPQDLASGLVDTPEGAGATPDTDSDSPRSRSRNTRRRSPRARTNGGEEPSASETAPADPAPTAEEQGVTVVKIEVEAAPESDKAATG